MKKTWLALIAGLVIVLSIVGLSGCSADGTAIGADDLEDITINVSQQNEGIWVSGEGKVAATPDIAVISLGIEAQAETVAAAQEQAATAMDAVLEALEDQGVQDKDIQTQYFNIYNVTRWVETPDYKGKEEVIGYRVTNMVTVKVRDIEKAGEVIDAVVAAGGDLTRVNNVSFDIEDKTPYYEQARTIAMEYAKKKANQLAEDSGVTLGKITYITENTYTPGPIYRNIAMDEAAGSYAPSVSTAISAGELELSTTIQLVYAIE